MSTVITTLIRLYQRTLSPDHSWLRRTRPTGTCRFHPTCSEYTRQAVIEWGAAHGLLLGVKRLLRCHPWSTGGYDPLPHHQC